VWFRFFAVSALLLLPACSLLVKSDDLVGGQPPASADAGPGTDASSPDGGSSDGGSSGPCKATFCDDFEDAGNIPWRTVTTGNGTAVVDGVKPHDGHSALHASRPTASGRDVASFAFTSTAVMASCEFDAYVTSPVNDYVSVFNLQFGHADPPLTSYSVSLQAGGSISQFGERTSGGPLNTSDHIDAFAFGRWTHVLLQFDWNAPSPAIRYTVDQTSASFAITPPATGPASLSFGIAFQSVTNSGAEVFVDNVACTTQ
jgi:hypothetical protein